MGQRTLWAAHMGLAARPECSWAHRLAPPAAAKPHSLSCSVPWVNMESKLGHHSVLPSVAVAFTRQRTSAAQGAMQAKQCARALRKRQPRGAHRGGILVKLRDRLRLPERIPLLWLLRCACLQRQCGHLLLRLAHQRCCHALLCTGCILLRARRPCRAVCPWFPPCHLKAGAKAQLVTSGGLSWPVNYALRLLPPAAHIRLECASNGNRLCRNFVQQSACWQATHSVELCSDRSNRLSHASRITAAE